MFGLPNFVFYLISGVIAALAVSAGRWLGQRFIPNFPDMPLLLGRLIDWGKPEPARTARVFGRYLHLTTGALWGLLFGIVVERQFFLVEFNVAQGVIFAILPWLFLMLVIMPLVHEGLFGVKVSKYYWLTSLVLYLLYGAVLGGLLSIFINRPF